MERTRVMTSRVNWEQEIVNDGLVYSKNPADKNSAHYWNEHAAFVFSPAEADELSRNVEEMEQMCRAAVEHIINGPLLQQMNIGELGVQLALESWRNQDPDFYGRMDFVRNEQGQMKFLEYNADTPTSILEAGVVQKNWFSGNHMGVRGYKDMNWLYENMVERWRQLRDQMPYPILHLACVREPSGEDMANLEVVSAAANEAGINTRLMHIEQLLWDDVRSCWVDPEGVTVKNLFKLYPWEDMVNDTIVNEQGEEELYMTVERYRAMDNWFEPAWKMFLSTKLLLVALHELYPGHPLLVKAGFSSDGMDNWVRKPYFGREGAGLTIHAPDYDVFIGSRDNYMDSVAADNEYIYQEYVHVPAEFKEGDNLNLLTMGTWVVNQRHVALSLRESEYRITDGVCRFVPSMIDGNLIQPQ